MRRRWQRSSPGRGSCWPCRRTCSWGRRQSPACAGSWAYKMSAGRADQKEEREREGEVFWGSYFRHMAVYQRGRETSLFRAKENVSLLKQGQTKAQSLNFLFPPNFLRFCTFSEAQRQPSRRSLQFFLFQNRPSRYWILNKKIFWQKFSSKF